jgi:uncharacterized protein YndB with AHSA1/START domain
MTSPSAYHSTLVVRRLLVAPAGRVFEALSDSQERSLYGASGEDNVILLDEADFRVGGHEAFRFGPRRNPRFRGRTTYHDIVPGHRIVATDVVYDRETPLSITVATLELVPRDAGTQVKLTAQIVWLDGADALDEATLRYETLIANLDRYLADAPSWPGASVGG